jgi:cold shock CspA family protein
MQAVRSPSARVMRVDRWLDSKGYGFVSSSTGRVGATPQTFVHKSQLKGILFLVPGQLVRLSDDEAPTVTLLRRSQREWTLRGLHMTKTRTSQSDAVALQVKDFGACPARAASRTETHRLLREHRAVFSQ